ncbi:phosphotransferase family protein [Mesobacillus selenatarsenatis]|uniref:Aminoglycoside phosphotransferase family protein n=1 Tax=Mesobacillus selenatarsenatis (strain DSM 18680 / JCM 14380 / FERM P-15431 / SF-1) TaxID=1321606 RepID=A0A0A8X168_MESS1|nr:phosphotransferase family protein [Mesobacillus selenatarsenatis]GAM12777.1 aminoglycoside phosphotransferase family protein [Mesobacillus selenatarsenatis SF-1]
MEHLFGQDWEIVPAGGATGAAYFAQHEEQRLFLKRNSSPFLAVLSAERIVPKLVWTKRLENGDVITAQQWMNGRELKPGDMNNDRVAKLLKKIHASEPLLGMLTRLGKSPLKPEMFLSALNEELDEELRTKQAVIDSMKFLTGNVGNIDVDEKVVCHCDVNHNNWLLTEDNQLYLIDWDGAMIADPAIDLGLLLYSYIPEEEWEQWLDKYGIILTENLKHRMKWYALAQSLSAIQWHKNQNRIPEMDKWIDFLKALI